MAAELRELYKDIDAVELYTGFILEKRRAKQLFGETLTEMGAPYSLKGSRVNCTPYSYINIRGQSFSVLSSLINIQ